MGEQAFIVAPLIKESETKNAENVQEIERLYAKFFPSFHRGILHGQLNRDEKERVLSQFIAGKTKILISTTVIEVGIDIKNYAGAIIHLFFYHTKYLNNKNKIKLKSNYTSFLRFVNEHNDSFMSAF